MWWWGLLLSNDSNLQSAAVPRKPRERRFPLPRIISALKHFVRRYCLTFHGHLSTSRAVRSRDSVRYPACRVLNVIDEPNNGSEDDELKDLDARLKAAEARTRKTADAGAEVGANQGFQVLGELIGGIFGGLGLGWLVDHYVHTLPWGMIVGTILGMVAAIYAIVKSDRNRQP